MRMAAIGIDGAAVSANLEISISVLVDGNDVVPVVL